MNEWKCIYTANQRYKAEIIKGILANENIEAVIMDRQDSSYTVFGDIQVYVQPEDENLAVELIKSAHIE
ncbi:MAG: DUF2007 domain-containing protein [Bacteroidales bacterium]|jgi:hypothetical protein|nr:DUF2007 domain-containing protein [Bacteroidales bacterium]